MGAPASEPWRRKISPILRWGARRARGAPAAVCDGNSGRCDEVLSATPYGAYRQLLAVGRGGPAAIHSGAQGARGEVGAAMGEDCAAAGNLLASSVVPGAMIAAFERADGHLGERLLRALRAGLDAGGEAGPVHSAGLLIVREVSWPIVDLRVDWTDGDPVLELHAIWERYAPQIDDYVRRALDPTDAPSFGVPGDL